MSKESQSRRAIDLGIDADAYAELSKLKLSHVFASFFDLRDDVYLEQVARTMGKPSSDALVFMAPALQR